MDGKIQITNDSFIENQKVFSKTVFSYGAAVYILGHDKEGEGLEGNYIISRNEGNKLILDNCGKSINVYLEDIEEGTIQIHIYSLSEAEKENLVKEYKNACSINELQYIVEED
ncbi:hypothetical protein [Chengkuizengella marina]|uniref:Uncharacterized protein n=1 Tax=Chengkuizengella marina TaxID=2507566 RepID=A0A6N9Q064_9BACL|nr:hypothetical protein [Chengkuizengella marina]NBI28073.1 hypothetical protein [Chengkuizengella marina]